MKTTHPCPRCGFPGKDPRAVRAGSVGGSVKSKKKGFGNPAVLAQVLEARRAKSK